MKITEVIKPSSVRLDLAATTKPDLIRILAREAAKSTGLLETKVVEAISAREALGSTGIGQGIALPHASVPGLAAPFALAVKLKAPVAFDAIDDLPVDIVVLILIPDQAREPHVDRLACVAKQLRSRDVQAQLRAARSPEQLYAAFVSGSA